MVKVYVLHSKPLKSMDNKSGNRGGVSTIGLHLEPDADGVVNVKPVICYSAFIGCVFIWV